MENNQNIAILHGGCDGCGSAMSILNEDGKFECYHEVGQPLISVSDKGVTCAQGCNHACEIEVLGCDQGCDQGCATDCPGNTSCGHLHYRVKSSCKTAAGSKGVLSRVGHCAKPAFPLLAGGLRKRLGSCTSCRGGRKVWHGDHYDLLVPVKTCRPECGKGCLCAEGYELHHPGPEGCEDHGTLLPAQSGPGSGLSLFTFDVGSTFTDLVIDGTTDPEETKPSTTTIVCDGICCASEVPLVQKCLGRLPGVTDIKVSVPSKMVNVEHLAYLTSPAALVASLNDQGLQARLKRDPPPPKPFPKILLLSGLLWLVSFGSHAEGFEDMKWCALLACLVGGPKIAKRAVAAVRNRVMDINFLMTTAVIGAIYLGDYVEAGAVVFLFSFSDVLESRATEGSRKALAEVLDLRPEEAEVAGRRVPVEQVKVGDVVTVRQGEKLPVDGLVVKGESTVDEAALTGESRPVAKAVGSTVSAGTMNGPGYLEVETTTTADNSTVARLVKLVEEAQLKRSTTEQVVEKFAKVYTPCVVLLAFLTAMVPAAMRHPDASEWFYTSLVLLVVACPCALVISTPITYVATIACAASHAVVVKGGRYLEALGHCRTMALDKTGTITEGRFKVLRALELVPGAWPLLAAVERKSNHPIAQAVLREATKQVAMDVPELCGEVAEATDFAVLPGEGVAASVLGKRVELGNQRLAQRYKWNVPAEVAKWEAQGATVILAGVDGVLHLCVPIMDAPRPEAKAAIKKLHKMGVETVMLTGDNAGAAQAIADAVGVKQVFAGLKPGDKVEHVAQLFGRDQRCRGRAKVCMVGDGINDAPALARADVGVAMGAAGTGVALETADVCLMDSDLTKLALAMELGKRTVSTISTNVTFSLGTKLIMTTLTLAGHASLWGAIVVDVGSMLIVTLNAGRILSLKRDTTHKLCPTAPAAKTESGCQKGCCGPKTEEPIGKPAASGCQKGCCGPKTEAPKVEAPKPAASGCQKGCCGPKAEAPKVEAPKPAASGCQKGCCGPKAEAPKPAQASEQLSVASSSVNTLSL